jgi:hypothetical protein
MAGYAGYLLTGKYTGVLAYSALALFSAAARQFNRNDDWAS